MGLKIIEVIFDILTMLIICLVVGFFYYHDVKYLYFIPAVMLVFIVTGLVFYRCPVCKQCLTQFKGGTQCPHCGATLKK